MPSANVCWGIEVGKGAVKALKLERSGDDVNVLDFAIVPHKRVLSTPELDVQDATRLAIGELVATRDLSGATIAISVPGDAAFARFAKLPPVETKKIPDIVKFEAVQQIPFPIDDVEWDYQTFASPDSPDVEVGIFAITRDRVMERLAMWADVGVTPDIVTLSPIAVYNALAWDMNFSPTTPGTVLLDVGTTSTDLIVAEAGRVWIRTFPIGGHQFTEKLVEAFKLSYPKAEALKRQAEQSTHARHVFQAMRPVFGDLAQDVQRSIGYYQSLHRDANLTRLIGLGSTFALPGLRKYLSQQLQMEVSRLEQFGRLNREGAQQGEFQAASINLATVYGLCLQGLGFDFGIRANLMPTSVIRTSMWKGKTKWFAAAAGVSVVGGLFSLVRPLMDDLAAETAYNSRPEVIGQATQLLTANKKGWNDVSGTFTPDPKAAVMLSLLSGRDVVPQLVDDAGQIVGAAAAKAVATGVSMEDGAFRFVEFKTDYLGTFADEAESAAADPAAGSAGPPADGDRRFGLSMEFSTAADRVKAEQEVVVAAMRWLRENAKRPGVPYEIDISTIKFDRGEEIKVPVPGTENDPFGAPTPPPRGERPIPGRQPDGRLQRPLPGGPRTGPQGVPGERGPRPAPGPTGEGNDDPGLEPGKGSEEVERLAPLPPPAPDGKPGSTIYNFVVKWEVVVPKPKPEEPAV